MYLHKKNNVCMCCMRSSNIQKKKIIPSLQVPHPPPPPPTHTHHPALARMQKLQYFWRSSRNDCGFDLEHSKMIFLNDSWYSGWWWWITILSLTNQRYCPGKHSLKFRTITVTLNTAKQPFHKTLQLMDMHCQTKLVAQKLSSSEHIIEIVIFHCMTWNSITVTLTLKINPFFAYDILAYNDVSPYWVWLQMVQQCISSKLTLTETFDLGSNIDLKHSNPSLDTSLLMMIYPQTEFGCKRLTGLELIKDIVETVIFWLYKPTLWPWPSRWNPIFSNDIPAHGGAPQYQVWLQKVVYKHSAKWEQICVMSITSLTPEDTTVLSLL